MADSPLSIAANVAGILTFVVAIVAALYVRLTYLRNADSEYFAVKNSLSWYKTESIWLHDLVNAADTPRSNEMEYQMYAFVMDQLGKLEERLLELVGEVEGGVEGKDGEEKWTLVPESWWFSTRIAMAWLPVRTKALELVKQRDALGSRVLFAQLSLVSTRVKDQESRQQKREDIQKERLDKLETIVNSQHEKLDRLEALVYRVMHRTRIEKGHADTMDISDSRHVTNLVSSQSSIETLHNPDSDDDTYRNT
ncbi:hypothetical protein PVAG01_04978 [Phlyctema vagabunda]|uniref:Uncharacterized protein n=1 Tax=Phlyctema vagabunda TaxID=108571 RepID=A0ABR4PJV4_9HELO